MTLRTSHHLDHCSEISERALSSLIRRMGITDLLVIIWAVLGAQLIRFGPDAAGAPLPAVQHISLVSTYTFFSAVLVGAWLLILRIHGAYDQRLLGHGPEEYKAVATASFWLFGVLAVVSYVLRLDVARGYVAMALPAGMIGLLVSRWLWRRWLTLHRVQGLMSASVLVVGDHDHLVNLIRALNSVPEAGYQVVAACCDEPDRSSFGHVPVLGDESEAAEVARRIGVNTVACTSSSRFGTDGLRRLSWALEGQNIDLVVAPGLTDVAGPRVLTRPVAGLSLLHVEAPVFDGPRLALKTVMDRCMAASLLILLSPLFAVVAVLIRHDCKGEVFFRQERIGKNGTTFPMLKFRTMLVGAEAMLPSLQERSEGHGPLFKLRDDPRVTRVGRFLRRWSLDELPQLLNVFKGEMSLVGPRPEQLDLVERYEPEHLFRLSVKPGMTGPMQINGRGVLTFDERLSIERAYIENLSLATDIRILAMTIGAVLSGKGAL